jgi:hypothetical protein
MQDKLDKLSVFCTDWCLDINIKKKKNGFYKAGKHLSHKFVLQNNVRKNLVYGNVSISKP